MKKHQNSKHLLLNYHFQCYLKVLKKIIIAEYSETSLRHPLIQTLDPELKHLNLFKAHSPPISLEV